VLFDNTKHIGAPFSDLCNHCIGISRIVLNRVSRIPANWPLIQDPTLLVTNLARLCAVRNINLMVIDDTAIQSETTGHIDSRWQNTARNIIRLRRVPLHGTEVVGMEIIRAGGTNVRALRPMELRSISARGAFSSPITAQFELVVADTFRGYTGIFSGHPQRCRTTVDLTYDHKNSALHHDGLNMKRNLEGIMENVTVNVFGPMERPGVNSALSNLSDVSHDTCHVVSIDEIWLPRLIQEGKKTPALVAFSQDELLAILPEHIISKINAEVKPQTDTRNEGLNTTPAKPNLERSLLKLAGKYYVTQALTVASRNVRARHAKSEIEPFYAIPFRHNWGVLAVVETIPDCIKNTITELNTKNSPGAVEVIKFLCNPRDLCVPCWEDILAFKMSMKDMPTYVIAKNSAKKSCVHIFDFQRETADSVVSFFLELLLSTFRISSIFCPIRRCRLRRHERSFSENTGLLFFLTRNWVKWNTQKNKATDNYSEISDVTESLEGKFKYVLSLMYHLLDEQQRNEIAHKEEITDTRLHTFRVDEDGGVKWKDVCETQEADVRSFSLISRQWLTTVSQGNQLFNDLPGNIDGQMVLKELPISKKVGCDPILFNSIFYKPASGVNPEKLKEEASVLRKQCMNENNRSLGVTLSGTWYLGTMSGGNRELATDIIKELVSEYHEMDRFLSGCGAPVSTRFYEENFWLGSIQGSGADKRSRIPYAGIIRTLTTCTKRTKTDDANSETLNNEESDITKSFRFSEIVFPFSRTRVQNYVMISLVLNAMIKKTMQLSENDVQKPTMINAKNRTSPLDMLVRYAVQRIDDIHWNSLYEETLDDIT